MTELRKKIDLLYGVSNIKDLPDVIDQINEELKELYGEIEDSKNDHKQEVSELKSELESATDALEELEEEQLPEAIDTGRSKQGIQWRADNLLDQQIMEALDDVLGKMNHIDVLRVLQNIASK